MFNFLRKILRFYTQKNDKKRHKRIRRCTVLFYFLILIIFGLNKFIIGINLFIFIMYTLVNLYKDL